MAKSKNKVYLVETAPDEYRLFHNWSECQAFVHGKPFAFVGAKDEIEAMAKLRVSKVRRTQGGVGVKPKAAAPTKGQTKVFGEGVSSKPKKKKKRPKVAPDFPTTGLASDAGTHGNPGPCEYQVTDMAGKVLAHRHLGVHSNNYAELAGIGAMIRYAIEHGETQLWTDSNVCLIWIRSGKVGPTVREPDKIMKMLRAINAMLADNPQLHLRKWQTKRWGEIPADFGRK